MLIQYWPIPDADFGGLCPACGCSCSAETVRRIVSNEEHITADYAACRKCSWEGFADMTRGVSQRSRPVRHGQLHVPGLRVV
jgi:hypothetical protein